MKTELAVGNFSEQEFDSREDIIIFFFFLNFSSAL